MAEQNRKLYRSFPFEERLNDEVSATSVVNKKDMKEEENPKTGTKTTIQTNLHRVGVGFEFLLDETKPITSSSSVLTTTTTTKQIVNTADAEYSPQKSQFLAQAQTKIDDDDDDNSNSNKMITKSTTATKIISVWV